MKASELRIGNYVHFDDRLLKFEFESGWNFDYIKPVPITNVRLLNFGFKKEKSDIPTFSKVYGEFIEDDYEHCLIINLDKDNNFYITINGVKLILKYVHQLQNLYFALTGTELIMLTNW